MLFRMSTKRRRQDAQNPDIVQSYLTDTLELDGVEDLAQSEICEVSPLCPEDIEYAIEGFSDRFAIEINPKRHSNENLNSQSNIGSQLRRIWLKLSKEAYYPFQVDLRSLTVGELVEAASSGYWPNHRLRSDIRRRIRPTSI